MIELAHTGASYRMVLTEPGLTDEYSKETYEGYELAFEGQDITVVGYYRGWDLLREANSSPPVTRSDWVIKDLTGAIYVSAHSEADVPEGLNPGSLHDMSIILEVKGVVRVNKGGQPYIEATSIGRLP